MAYQEDPKKQRSIQFQSANNGASNIVGGMAAAGMLGNVADVLTVFDQVRDHIFHATLGDGADTTAAVPAAAPAAKKSYPKQEEQAPTGFAGEPTDTLACFTKKDDAGNTVARYKGPGGKFANATLEAIVADEKGENFLKFISEQKTAPAELVAGVKKFLASR